MKTVKIPLTEDSFLSGKPFSMEPGGTLYKYDNDVIKRQYSSTEFLHIMNYEPEKHHAYSYKMLMQKVEFKLKFATHDPE